MKGTEHFKQAIKAYLDERAKTDELFAVSYAKENKNLDDCVTFILNQAMAICKEGGCGMTDDEVYSLGVHYYDEDDIEVGKAVNCGVIVNHRVELSPEEQAEARENALKAYQNEELRKIQQRNSKPKPTPKAVRQEPERTVTATDKEAGVMGIPSMYQPLRIPHQKRRNDLYGLRLSMER